MTLDKLPECLSFLICGMGMMADGCTGLPGGFQERTREAVNTVLGVRPACNPQPHLPSAGRRLPAKLPRLQTGAGRESGHQVRSCSQGTRTKRRGSTRAVPLLVPGTKGRVEPSLPTDRCL